LKCRLDGVGIGVFGKLGIGAEHRARLFDPVPQHVLDRARRMRKDEGVALPQASIQLAEDRALARSGSAGQAQAPRRPLLRWRGGETCETG
jgi:hypothetical protein